MAKKLPSVRPAKPPAERFSAAAVEYESKRDRGDTVRVTRLGVRGRINAWVPLELARAYEQLALDEERKKNELLAEALEMLFESRRRKAAASKKK
jgi:hypothetical protein